MPWRGGSTLVRPVLTVLDGPLILVQPAAMRGDAHYDICSHTIRAEASEFARNGARPSPSPTRSVPVMLKVSIDSSLIVLRGPRQTQQGGR